MLDQSNCVLIETVLGKTMLLMFCLKLLDVYFMGSLAKESLPRCVWGMPIHSASGRRLYIETLGLVDRKLVRQDRHFVSLFSLALPNSGCTAKLRAAELFLFPLSFYCTTN